MARNGNKKTIFWLIVILIIVCWIELVMVVKFFTKEYMRYTMEKNNNSAVAYYEDVTLDEKQGKKEYLSIAQGSEGINQDNKKIEKVENKYEEEVAEKITPNIIVEPETQDSNIYIKQEVSSRSYTEKKNVEVVSPTPAQTQENVQAQNSTTEAKIVQTPVATPVQASGPTSTPTPAPVTTNNTSVMQKAGVEKTYKGYDCIGKIEIPKTGVNLPILSKVTVNGMEIAPCLVYSTGSLNYSGKNLIGGHNYRNGKLFSNNNKLQVGDKFYITSLDGNRVEYVIYNKVITTPEDVNFLVTESSQVEVFLSSCSDDNIKRVVIMARKV